MSPVLQGQIRTILAGIAGIAVTQGWINAETAGYVVGIGLFVVTALWSWKSKPVTNTRNSYESSRVR